MACMFEGAGSRRIQFPDWIARNAVHFLLPLLNERSSGRALAERLAPVLTNAGTHVRLGDLLNDAETAEVWRLVVGAADAEIEAEPAESWNDPAAHEPFRRRFAELRLLVDG